MRKIKDKKAVSLMVSYVILISIAIGLSIAVFVWLKDYANISPKIDCKEGTSIILEDYSDNPGTISLTLKNNGLFNISGIILHVGNNTERTPIDRLMPDPSSDGGNLKGYYDFDPDLGPNNLPKTIIFSKDDSNAITIISIQPYIKNEKGDAIVCESAVIKQNLE